MNRCRCHVCGLETFGAASVEGTRVPLCLLGTCTAAFTRELELVAAMSAWLEAFPVDDEHGPLVHGGDGILEQFRRGDWRPAPKGEPTGVVAGDPQRPGDGTAREIASSRAVQGGAGRTEAELQAAEKDVRVVLLSDGALMVFRGDADYRVLPRVGNATIPNAFFAHELADAYEDRAEMLREAIGALT